MRMAHFGAALRNPKARYQPGILRGDQDGRHGSVLLTDEAMLDPLIAPLLWFSAIGSGLIAGLSLAFTTFIPDALEKLDRRDSVAAMNALISGAVRSPFAVLFYAVLLSSLLLGIETIGRYMELMQVDGFAFDHWTINFIVIGSGAYLFGVTLPTLTAALNWEFERKAPDFSRDEWTQWLRVWKLLNFTRTFGAVAATATFAAALWSL